MRKSKADDLNYWAMAEFRYAVRRYLSFSARVAREAGLEPQQYQALLALKGLPQGRKPTVRELAERLQIKHHSAVELANRLEAKKLIRRSRNSGDRREILLQLAPLGESKLKDLGLTHWAELQVAGPELKNVLTSITIKVKNWYGTKREKFELRN